MKTEVPWSGEPFTGSWLAFDTETTVVDLQREVPTLCVLTASDGDRTVWVKPSQMNEFVIAHGGLDWVGWNTQFDWWVVRKALWENNDPWGLAYQIWLGVANDQRLHDGMLLDQLVRLGEGRDDVGLFSRSLAKASSEYLVFHDLTKDESVRLTFTPERGEYPDDLDYRWIDYALEDARTTAELWVELTRRARIIKDSVPNGVLPASRSARAAGGSGLTEPLQTQASIVLAQITRNGFGLDVEALGAALIRSETECRKHLETLQRYIPKLVKTYKDGRVKITKGSGVPQLCIGPLREYLQARGRQLMTEEEWNGLPVTAKTGQLPIAAEVWETWAQDDEVIMAWCGYQDSTKTYQLLSKLRGQSEVHPRYSVMVRTGRTSSSDPNIQQIPREGWFRSLFKARPGHKLITVDYSAIELRTLASVMEYRYGKSVLADVLREGRDPHAFTAALVLGERYDYVTGILGSKDHPQYSAVKKARQSAKAINFGVPGGLGAKKLAGYAKKSYGVDMSQDEAAVLRNKLIQDVYPELTTWLKESFTLRLATSLGVSEEDVEAVFGKEDNPWGDPMDHPAARVIAGLKTKKNGTRFSAFFINDVWLSLEALVIVSESVPKHLVASITRQHGSPELAAYLIQIPCVTLTGRVRRKTHYGDYRNTQFQGLAADGAKAALWDLMTAGYKIVAFVHDEIVVEVPEENADESRLDVERRMVESFARLLPNDIPITVEGNVSDRWAK